MRQLEQLWNLPQPEFELGSKTPLGVVARRTFQQFGRNPEAINAVTKPFASERIRDIARELEESPEDPFMEPAQALLQRNLIYFPNQVFLRASPFHCDNWLRDSFIGTLFLEKPTFESHVLSGFLENRLPSGQLPTNRLFPGNRRWMFDDESTMLGLIWRAKLQGEGASLNPSERQEWQQSWEWIESHVADGLYISPPGTERSWFDTYKLEDNDTLTYNQGVYATATLAAGKLRLILPDKALRTAADAYQNLRLETQDRLPFSWVEDSKDVSALFGEYLALTLFGESFLQDTTVRGSLEALKRTDTGIPVVVNPDDSYLSPNQFNRPYRPGDYQNGGDWPAFNAMAFAVGEMHGMPHSSQSWHDLLTNLKKTQHAEYRYTGSLAQEATHNKTREHNLWNTVVYDAAKRVMDENEQKAVLNRTTKTDDSAIYAEAAELPGSTL